jgi:hypothetical protein
MPARVFVSHSRKDGRPIATRLKKELESKGHEIWLDDQLDLGTVWSR